MEGRFKFEKLPHYAHMAPEDALIWNEFIESSPDFYDTVDYDVRVGEGRPYQEVLVPKIKEDMVGLSKHRIDVVGYKGSRTDVVEIKPSAGSNAIGQVMTYALLWHQGFRDQPSPRRVIITDKMDPDSLSAAKALGIYVVQIHPD